MNWFKTTKNPLVEIDETKYRRTKITIPKERVRELLEEEARKIYDGKGRVDYFTIRETGILSTNPVKENIAEFIFYESL